MFLLPTIKMMTSRKGDMDPVLLSLMLMKVSIDFKYPNCNVTWEVTNYWGQ